MGPKTNPPGQDNFGFAEGFEYDAFEEQVTEDPPPDVGQTEPPRQAPVSDRSRPTFDRRLVPKGDAAFTARTLGRFKVVSIGGRMNESFPSEEICAELQGPSVLDLRNVDRVSSFGVRGWLQMLQQARTEQIYLSHCSDAIVSQITMMRNFCGSARIHSFLAPYACDACGADFGVYYHAIEDRQRIEARRPVEVPCPECAEPTEMDEDPFTYFDLVDHLLAEPPPELDKVIGELEGGARVAPIAIELDGSRTVIRFHDAIDGSTRLRRVFKNVEGQVTVDLRSVAGIDAAGSDNLVDALSRIDAAISDVQIEGSPDELTERIVQADLDRVQLRSLVTPVVDQLGGMVRPAMIDLTIHAEDLLAGKALSLAIPWAKGQVVPQSPELVRRVLVAPPQASLTATPAPAAKYAPRPVAPSVRTSGVVAALVALFALGVGVLLAGLAFFLLPGSKPVPPGPLPVAQPTPLPEGAWSSGGELPPPWAELRYSRSGGEVWVVGRGVGTDAEDAGRMARTQADAELGEQIASALQTSPAAAGLPALDTTPELASALAGLGMLRRDEAVRVHNGRTEVVARYSLSSVTLDAQLATWSRTGAFRGIEVAHNPPWRSEGLRLIKAASWFGGGVSAGDPVLTVGGKPVTSVADFRNESAAAFDATRPGSALQVGLLHAGRPVVLSITKKRAAPAVVPVRPAPVEPVAPRPRPSRAPGLLPLED